MCDIRRVQPALSIKHGYVLFLCLTSTIHLLRSGDDHCELMSWMTRAVPWIYKRFSCIDINYINNAAVGRV